MIANKAELPAELEKIKVLAQNYASSAEKLDQMFANRSDITSDERSALTRIKAVEARTLPLIAQVITLRMNDRAPEALDLLMAQARPAFVEWLSLINQMIDLEEGMSKQAASQAYAVASDFSVLMWGLTLVLFVLGGGVAWVLARSFLQPLTRACPGRIGRGGQFDVDPDYPWDGRAGASAQGLGKHATKLAQDDPQYLRLRR
ncbi:MULTISPECIES: hypothetical protein [unclassified Pseudomonas]|uniref:MCP four helix bundle domain-containing protein n=1 Tax=unclassified Pseudomonas TaxID=196821 RepID=UPI00211405A2|nr:MULTISPECIES: hypothetical protein [unclassified Pseudomonas]